MISPSELFRKQTQIIIYHRVHIRARRGLKEFNIENIEKLEYLWCSVYILHIKYILYNVYDAIYRICSISFLSRFFSLSILYLLIGAYILFTWDRSTFVKSVNKSIARSVYKLFQCHKMQIMVKFGKTVIIFMSTKLQNPIIIVKKRFISLFCHQIFTVFFFTEMEEFYCYIDIQLFLVLLLLRYRTFSKKLISFTL